MPGRPNSDQQATAYMQDRHRHSQRIAAARASFDERTARRLDADRGFPSRGRTVPDPLKGGWKAVLVPILERDPSVQAETLLRHWRDACRRMVEKLWLTHKEACEAELAHPIAEDLNRGDLPDAHTVRTRLEPRGRAIPPDIPVALTGLA